MSIPTVTGVPYIDTDQMREVDRAMVEDYHIDLIQMMENAGRNLAQLARYRFFAGRLPGRRVTVLAGIGGNGGGALVCARHLANHGAIVEIFTTRPAAAFTPVAKHQLEILARMGVSIFGSDKVTGAAAPDLTIDGVIGYSLRGAPRAGAAALIQWAIAGNSPILALDAPSGVDTTTGQVYNPAIRATATMTLALPKEGLRTPGVADHVGELFLADISVPPALYARVGLTVGHIFAENEIVRLS